MTRIQVREQASRGDGANADGRFSAVLRFDEDDEYPVTVGSPFSDKEETRLEWYFEQHVAFPFTQQVKAKEAAASIAAYGEGLFQQLFAEPKVYARYIQARSE